jgi:hypothetical protein
MQQIDRLQLMADHAAKRPEPTSCYRWYYSEALKERYQFGHGGALRFESGITYTGEELNKLRAADSATKIAVHNVKRMFEGALVV